MLKIEALGATVVLVSLKLTMLFPSSLVLAVEVVLVAEPEQQFGLEWPLLGHQ